MVSTKLTDGTEGVVASLHQSEPLLVVTGAEVPHPVDAEATQKLQSQYDATKHLKTEVALQQASGATRLQTLHVQLLHLSFV